MEHFPKKLREEFWYIIVQVAQVPDHLWICKQVSSRDKINLRLNKVMVPVYYHIGVYFGWQLTNKKLKYRFTMAFLRGIKVLKHITDEGTREELLI